MLLHARRAAHSDVLPIEELLGQNRLAVAAQLKHVAGEAATDAREVPRGVWQDPQVARLISGLVFVKLGASGETTIGNLTSLKHRVDA